LIFSKWKIKFTFAKLVVISMVLGIGCGIIFGERCGYLLPIGKIYIALLQMCVLPYIIVSIMYGIGRLGIKESKELASKGVSLTLIFWGITLFYIILMPVCFPAWEPAIFFSSNIVEATTEIDYLKLYIPSNPFYSLANNLVPAITVFSICIGVALITIRKKAVILQDLEIFRETLSKVNGGIVKLTPIGTFALLANLTGTITIDEIAHMQVYLFTTVTMALLLTFCVFPLLVMTFTELKYRQIMHTSKDAMLTAFATGNVFILLPIISRNLKQLMKDTSTDNQQRLVLLDTIVPITFSFPLGGKVILLLFLPFAAWFYGIELDLWDYPQFIISGMLTMFGSSVESIRFLLNYFHIPADIIDFFTAFNVINSRIGALFSAIYLTAFGILCTAWLTGMLKVNLKKTIKNLSVILIVTALTFTVCAVYLRFTMDKRSNSKDILSKMKITNTVPAKIYLEYPTPQQVPPISDKNSFNNLAFIKKRGVLRVGYSPSSRPFSYFNSKGKLIGYDITMAHMLARDLGCTLEFIPIKYDDLGRGLSDGVIDVIMAGTSLTLKRIKYLSFTHPYMTINLAFIVKDYEREGYRLMSDIQKRDKLLVACVPGVSYRDYIKNFYPNLVFVDIEDEEDFFTGKVKADALLDSAEEGFSWCVLYPAFSVIVPRPTILKETLAYVISQKNTSLRYYINNWLKVQQTACFLDYFKSYWVMGKNVQQKEKRWCLWDEFVK
jgi:Na+/H+-dicarboxylate symporter/ABC-type amino acid transport substrate-binding protein